MIFRGPHSSNQRGYFGIRKWSPNRGSLRRSFSPYSCGRSKPMSSDGSSHYSSARSFWPNNFERWDPLLFWGSCHRCVSSPRWVGTVVSCGWSLLAGRGVFWNSSGFTRRFTYSLKKSLLSVLCRSLLPCSSFDRWEKNKFEWLALGLYFRGRIFRYWRKMSLSRELQRPSSFDFMICYYICC